MRRTFAVVGAILVALAGNAASRLSAQDCVRCDDILNSCDQDSTSSACECVFRSIKGTLVCREQGWTCGQGSDCSGGPQPQIRPKSAMAVEAAAITKLEESEPLLAIVLLGSVDYDATKHAYLAARSYPGGTIHGKNMRYRHRGLFELREDGQIAFQFVLNNLDDGSKVTFSGLLGEGGRSISYSKISQLSPDTPAQRVNRVWKMPD